MPRLSEAQNVRALIAERQCRSIRNDGCEPWGPERGHTENLAPDIEREDAGTTSEQRPGCDPGPASKTASG
jgi:hypothetical protein